MATIDELNVVIGAKIDDLEKGMGKATATVERFGATTEAVAGRYIDAQGRMRDANGRFVSSATLAAEAARNVGGAFAGTGSAAQGLAGSINSQLTASFAAFDKKSGELEKGIGRLGKEMKDVGGSLTTYVTLPLGLVGAAAISAAGKIDSLQRGLQAVTQQEISKQGITGLEAISRAAEETTARMLELKEIAKAPGIGFEQAVKGDIRLRSVGMAATDSAKALKEFANSIAATGGGAGELDRVTVQLAQLSAKGKVLAQDLRPIIEAAPGVSQALIKLYQTVDSETISKSLEKQGKSSQDFINTLVEELAKAPRVTGGLANSLENLAQEATQGAAKIGMAADKVFGLNALANRASATIERLADTFEALDPATQKLIFGLGAAAAAAGPLLFVIGGIGAAMPALIGGFTLLTGPVGLVAAAVVAAAALIIANWDELSAYFRGEGGRVFSDLRDSAVETGAAIANVFGGLNTLSQAGLGGLLSEMKPVNEAIREIGDGFTGLLDTVNGTLNFITDLLSGRFRKALEDIVTVADGLTRPLRSMFGLIEEKSANFSDFFGLKPAVEEVVGLVGGDIAAAMGKVIGLTEDQQKALDKLNEALRLNTAYERVLGDSYDEVAERARILETGVKSLTAAFGAGSPVVAKYLKMYRDTERQLKDITPRLNPIDPTVVRPSTLPSQLAAPDYTGYTQPLDLVLQQVSERRRALVQQQTDFNTEMGALMESLSSGAANVLADVALQFGAAFGDMITGTATAGEALAGVFGGILQSMASFMSQWGTQLIAIGIGKDAFDKLFTAPGTGPLAIAAGIGLVALGGLAASIGKSAAAGARSAGSGGRGLASGPSINYGGGAGTRQLQPIQIVSIVQIDGREIGRALRSDDYRRQRTG